MRHFALLATLLLCIFAATPCFAEEVLPHAVQAQMKAPLKPMGSTTYRKFGFSIYRATLWTADGTWNRKKPYALQLHYLRDLSKDTLVDNVTDDIREQAVASDATVDGWYQMLADNLTDVKDGDILTSVYLPDREKSPLFLNDKIILSTGDRAFMNAFINIWLGPNADEDMREKLLASAKN